MDNNKTYCDDCKIYVDDIIDHYGDFDHLNKTNFVVFDHLKQDPDTGEIWFIP